MTLEQMRKTELDLNALRTRPASTRYAPALVDSITLNFAYTAVADARQMAERIDNVCDHMKRMRVGNA